MLFGCLLQHNAVPFDCIKYRSQYYSIRSPEDSRGSMVRRWVVVVLVPLVVEAGKSNDSGVDRRQRDRG